MKKSFSLLAFAVISLGISRTQASIVYTDIADATVSYSTSVNIDFNNDASPEFTLSDQGGGSPDPVMAGTMFDDTMLNFMTWSSAEDWDVFKNLSYGTSIGAASGFYAYGDCYFNPFWATNIFPSASDQYLGVKFKIGSNWHYGWVRVNLAANGQLTVKDYAYENTPGTAINAGATSTTGVETAASEGSVSMSPNPFTDIVTVTCASPVRELVLSDVNGRVLKRTSFVSSPYEVRIDLRDLPAGMYVITVKTDNPEPVIRQLMKI